MKDLTAIMLSVLLLAFLSCSDNEEISYSLQADKTKLVFAFDGTSEDGKLEITTAGAWKLTIPDAVDWICCTPTEGTGNATVQLSVAATNGEESTSRKATITLESTEYMLSPIVITVAQEAYVLKADKAELSFAANGSAKDSTLKVTSNLKWKLVIPDEADWITCTPTEGVGNATVKFSITDSGISPSRNAIVSLESVNRLAELVPIKISQIESEINVFDYIEDEAFRAYCEQFDTDKNKKLTRKEALEVTTITIAGKEVKSLEGIELFPKLSVLICDNNQLRELAIGKNTLLTELSCSQNTIVSLDISKNKQLVSLTCTSNPLLKTVYVWSGFDTANPQNTLTTNCSYDTHTQFVVKP